MVKKPKDNEMMQVSLFDEAPAVDLSNFLPLRLIAAARLVERRLARLLQANHGIGIAEWLVLAALVDADSVSVRDLGPVTGLDAVAISRAATRLSDRKLIGKKENRQDRRLIVMKPTKAGRGLIASIGGELQPLEMEIFKGLGAPDRIRLAQLMGAIHIK